MILVSRSIDHMAPPLVASLCFLPLLLLLIPPLPLQIHVRAQQLSSCGGSCKTSDNCDGELVCINRRCNDDPEVGTNICSGDAGGNSTTCRPFGTVYCEGNTNPKYRCSPPVNSSTPALLTHNDFTEAGGSGEAACDGKFHSNSERVVSLSTGWFDTGRRCGKLIQITASNGRSTTAKVVDECDSSSDCTADNLAPCIYNALDASDAVWNALNLAVVDAGVDVTWKMAQTTTMARTTTVSLKIYPVSYVR